MSNREGKPLEASNLRKNDALTLFRTAAWLDEERGIWTIPIHGWVYQNPDSRVRKKLIAKIIKEKYQLVRDETTEANFSKRVNLLIADNERGKRVIINLEGEKYIMPKSSANGHFSGNIELTAERVSQISRKGVIHFEVLATDGRIFRAEVRLVEPEGVSIISDIDDTVKISKVTDRKQLVDSTFFQDFRAISGMGEWYHSFAKKGAAFHFVSSSPWQLYNPIVDMLDASGFPKATLSLKFIRFKDRTIFNLFKKATVTKPAQIEPILATYPKRKFVLVGDSGEHDPEVYADIMKRYPGQVEAIYIRNITEETIDNERFTEVMKGLNYDQWVLFKDPKELEGILSQ